MGRARLQPERHRPAGHQAAEQPVEWNQLDALDPTVLANPAADRGVLGRWQELRRLPVQEPQEDEAVCQPDATVVVVGSVVAAGNHQL